MREGSGLGRLAKRLPAPLVSILRALRNYFYRLRSWTRILVDVRGATAGDAAKLVACALAAPLTALRRLSAWQDPVLLFDCDVVVRDIGRFHLRRGSDDLWFVVPWREKAIVDALRTYLRAGDTFVDAGANIGFYTVLAAALVGPGGKVIAIEMMPDTAAILRAHIALNGIGNVTVVESALSNSDGEVVSARVSHGRFGQASIVGGKGEATDHEIKVPTVTLSRLLTPLGRVALMKMDLEGAEGMALRGAASSLRKVERIVFEQWDETGEAMSRLREDGFRIDRLDSTNYMASHRAGLQG
jgi:FkbM family methyltransferase